MCGRCENDTGSCDRSPTEFSFGAQSECSSCLDGWVGTRGCTYDSFWDQSDGLLIFTYGAYIQLNNF